MYHKVTVLGRVTKEPELNYTAGGMAICPSLLI
jgi:single-stranded DNA-binding protein